MVAHIITVIFSAFMLYTAWPGSSLFSWHPTFMTLAFVAGMFEALMVFNRESSLFMNASRPTKVLVHHVLQVFAIVCAMCGFGIIYYNKMLNNKSHFTTWHGLFGVITISSLPLAAVGGNVVKYQFLRDMLRIKTSLAELKIYHATGGLIVFTLVMFTLMLSLYSNWFTGNVDGILWYACAMCVSFMAVVVMNQVTQEYLPKTRSPKQTSTPQLSGSANKKESKKKEIE